MRFSLSASSFPEARSAEPRAASLNEGGPFADAMPFPVPAPTLTDASTPDQTSISLTWEPNLSYRVTNSAVPGGYGVHCKRGGAPEPPFDGTDADGGTQPSPIEVGIVTTYVLENLSFVIAAPLAPRLLTAEGRNRAVILTWEAVQGATDYRVLTASAPRRRARSTSAT